MFEHLIRLRGGWECHDPDGGPARRLTLPVTWTPGVTGRRKLLRSFQRPPFDPTRESLALRLESITGVVVVRLNGRERARPGASPGVLLLSLDDPLPLRNLLELEIEPTACGPEPWGVIALVVTEREGGT
jgi:hypothetical protein